MSGILINNITTLISNLRGLEYLMEQSVELPEEQITKILADAKNWPIQTRPFYIARAVSRLTVFFYHIKSDQKKWNPLTTSHTDFILQNPNADTWIDEDQFPSSDDIVEWLVA
jgi:hypothetical protein